VKNCISFTLLFLDAGISSGAVENLSVSLIKVVLSQSYHDIFFVHGYRYGAYRACIILHWCSLHTLLGTERTHSACLYQNFPFILFFTYEFSHGHVYQRSDKTVSPQPQIPLKWVMYLFNNITMPIFIMIFPFNSLNIF